MTKYLMLRVGPLTRLVTKQSLFLAVGLTVALLTALLFGTALGSTVVPFNRIVAGLSGSGTHTDIFIVRELRLPRLVEAVEVGAALGVAGFLLQAATRNPLASPAVLGIVDGAALGAVLFLVFFSEANYALTVSMAWQPLAAGVAAVLFVILLFAFARGQSRTPVRLILYGVAIAAVAQAVTVILMVTGPVHRASQVLQWLAGSVHTATWQEVAIIGAVTAPLFLIAGAFARSFTLLDLDGQSARGVGLSVAATATVAVLLASLLAAAAVAFTGGIRFVGLLAPHLARRLIGAGAGTGILASALFGAIIVVMSDIAVRVLFAPLEVPTGVITAVIGAPYLIYLVIHRSRTDG